jgi:branched-chain amino acid transport system permease protein
LILLMVAVALHSITGLALLYLDRKDCGRRPSSRGHTVSGFAIPQQLILIVGAAIFSASCSVLPFTVEEALRAVAINRGRRLVGIWIRAPAQCRSARGGIAASRASDLADHHNLLRHRLIVGLKGFIGSGHGFVSLAAVGAIVIGLVESFGSFYYSALRDAIVFAAIIPIVLWRWFYDLGA